MSAARSVRLLGVLVAGALVVVLLSIATGTNGLVLGDLREALSGEGDSLRAQVLRELRLPRVATAFVCGALLGLAGALMQVLFRNALADPYVLGMAGGAGLGALSVMAFGAGMVSTLAGAWTGALVSVGLLLVFGRASVRSGGAIQDVQGVLLTGVALASGWAAMITLVLALAPEASLKGMLFWLMGDLDGADDWRSPAAALAACLVGAWWLARALDVICLGDATARTLGVAVERTRLAAMLVASLATASAVTTAGTIGFVGLIVPNAVRAVIGNDQRWVLPVSALGGGVLLTAADTFARTLVAPMQLPVGAVMALIGVPAFIGLLAYGRLRA